MEVTIVNNGLYNVLFGNHPEVPVAYKILHGTYKGEDWEIGRLRDMIFEQHDQEFYIRVHTRLGGDNRIGNEDVIRKMQGHHLYVKDMDCQHDNTYADFYYTVPSHIVGQILSVIDGPTEKVFKPPLDMGARFSEAMKAMEDDGAEGEAMRGGLAAALLDDDNPAIQIVQLTPDD